MGTYSNIGLQKLKARERRPVRRARLPVRTSTVQRTGLTAVRAKHRTAPNNTVQHRTIARDIRTSGLFSYYGLRRLQYLCGTQTTKRTTSNTSHHQASYAHGRAHVQVKSWALSRGSSSQQPGQRRVLRGTVVCLCCLEFAVRSKIRPIALAATQQPTWKRYLS